MRVRQTILGDADKCLRALQYKLEAPPDLHFDGSVRRLGTAYHYDKELFYKDRTLPYAERIRAAKDCFREGVERAGEHFVWNRSIPDEATAFSYLESMCAEYEAGGHAWPEDWEVLGNELTFTLPFLEGHSRHGTIDRALRSPTGCIYGVDDKTAARAWSESRAHPRKNNQAPFYVAALQELFPDAPDYRFVFDVMSYPKKDGSCTFQRLISDPTPAHIDAVMNKALQVATLYEVTRGAGLDLPGNPASLLCSAEYCDFFAQCPHGASLS